MINNGFKIIEIIVELADRIEDAINGIQNAFLIWRNVGDDVKPLLNYMRINSNNLFLNKSIDKYLSFIDSGTALEFVLNFIKYFLFDETLEFLSQSLSDA